MVKINIIGRGINPEKHLSIFSINLLKNADKIIGIETEFGFWDNLQKKFNLPPIENIPFLYKNNDWDLTNYQRFVNYIIELSHSFSNIVLLIAGHPRVGVSFIDLLKKNLPKSIELEIIEGISSFDVMINVLQMDPLEQGTALLDANRLLLFKYTLDTSISYFIYHVSSIGNSKTNYMNPNENNRVELLVDYLLMYYKKDKEVFICKCSNGSNEQSKLITINLSDLHSIVDQIDYSSTLFIPAEKPKEIDWNFLKLLG